jgi:hypothetical protein
MQPILAAATDTMTRGPLRRLQELAQGLRGSLAHVASDKGGESGRLQKLAGAAWKTGACCERQRRRILGARASNVQSATDSWGSGPLTTIEPMTIQAACNATRPNLAKDSRASG